MVLALLVAAGGNPPFRRPPRLPRAAPAFHRPALSASNPTGSTAWGSPYPAMTSALLEIHGLACRRAGRVLFAGLDLDLGPGSAALVTGPNGSGKSSFLRVAAGLIPPFAGAILWQGADSRREPEAFRSAMRYVGHADGLQPALSVIENLRYWAALYGGDAGRTALLNALEAVGLDALADLPARLLSAGQRRRLALARLPACDSGGPSLWLLDEPTIALDAPSVARVEAMIAAKRAAGGVVVASTNAPLTLPDAAQVDIAAHRPDLPEAA